MLQIRNVSKVYGEGEARVVALNNVSLEVLLNQARKNMEIELAKDLFSE